MDRTITWVENELRRTRSKVHPNCWVCGRENPQGLALDFQPDDEGRVVAWFGCDARYTGYCDQLHGGLISTLLDGAMTSWLMAHGEVAMTVDLRVRFHRPVRVDHDAQVRAWRERTRHGVHLLCAELWQDGQCCAGAQGSFLRRREPGGEL